MHCARRTAFGEKHGGLSGRVAAADHGDVGAVVEIGFDGRAGVVDAGAGVAVRSRRLQLAPTPAGPAPTIARSMSCDGQCFQMPAAHASSCKPGFTRMRSPHSITGVLRGEPSSANTRRPASVSVSNHVNGTKFLWRNSRTVFVSRQRPGPTTRMPT